MVVGHVYTRGSVPFILDCLYNEGLAPSGSKPFGKLTAVHQPPPATPDQAIVPRSPIKMPSLLGKKFNAPVGMSALIPIWTLKLLNKDLES